MAKQSATLPRNDGRETTLGKLSEKLIMQIEKNNPRQYSKKDQICIGFDQALKALLGQSTAHRSYPAENLSEPTLTSSQKNQAAALMRINHAGEVCAQALYHSQGLVSRGTFVRLQLQQAAIEEGDHLAWCSRRLCELGSHRSYLNPVWYIGSFMIGLSAGVFGDEWNLGFLAETEKQVVTHLEKQLTLLPLEDTKSEKILQQMQTDEAKHRNEAIEAGAKEIPAVLKIVMKLTSAVMVKLSYWI